MKELIEKIGAAYETFSANANVSLNKGNKSAGLRARKASVELDKLLKQYRKDSLGK